MDSVVIKEDISDSMRAFRRDTAIPVSLIVIDEQMSFHIEEAFVGSDEFPAQVIRGVNLVQIPGGYTPVILKSGKLGILENIDLEWEHPTRQFQITS